MRGVAAGRRSFCWRGPFHARGRKAVRPAVRPNSTPQSICDPRKAANSRRRLRILIDTIPKLESAASPTKQSTAIISNRYKLALSGFQGVRTVRPNPTLANISARRQRHNPCRSRQFLIATTKRLESLASLTKQTADAVSNRHKIAGSQFQGVRENEASRAAQHSKISLQKPAERWHPRCAVAAANQTYAPKPWRPETSRHRDQPRCARESCSHSPRQPWHEPAPSCKPLRAACHAPPNPAATVRRKPIPASNPDCAASAPEKLSCSQQCRPCAPACSPPESWSREE